MLLRTILGVFVATHPHLQLLLRNGQLRFDLLALLSARLKSLCELDDLVLQAVRDLLELGDRASLGLECLEFLASQTTTDARLQVDDVLDIGAESSP